MHRDDLPVLKEILSHTVDPIEVIIYIQLTGKHTHTSVNPSVEYSTNMMFLMLISPPLYQIAGLHPTAEQIEMFAYHLPDATLSNLVVSKVIYSFIFLAS